MRPSKQVANLVSRFLADQARYCSGTSGYTETEVRVEFIDPLFAIIGWDMANSGGLPNSLKDVVREESQSTETSTKRPDYTFRVASIRKFFLEAKKPSVDIRTNRDSAFQIRSYGWTAGLSVSILTNFRILRVYDTRSAPNEADHADTGLLLEIMCEEFETRINEIHSLFGREAVATGSLETNFRTSDTGGIPIGKVFLDRFNSWRLKIATDLCARYPSLGLAELNDLSQKIINRVIFVRMCEDRGIAGEGALRKVAEKRNIVELRRFFKEMDNRYNTGLFDVAADPLQSKYALSSAVFLEIVEELYFPKAPYSFSVLDADFLGQVYEHFLSKQLMSNGAGEITLNDKPAYEGREIVTTPQPIVDELVRRTFSGRLSVGIANLEALKALRVLDVAVGSSRFLLRALDELIDAAITCFRRTGDTSNIYRRSENDYRLRFEIKRDILLACLYGIDIDYNAVEVARFSLLVKLLEDENRGTLPTGRKILPNLNRNIIWGNSVVGADFPSNTSTEPALPLDWSAAGMPDRFDVVIGNPPYVKTEEMKKAPDEFAYYKRKYETPFKQFDKYFVFIEKAVSVIRDGAWIGMVVPNKWITIEAGAKLRAFLARQVLVSEIVDFGNELLFEGKSTYVCLLVLSRATHNSFQYRQVCNYDKWLLDPGNKGISLNSDLIRNFGSGSWILPSTPSESAVLTALYTNSIRLRDIANVVNGIQTSAEDVFPIQTWTESRGIVQFTRDGLTWTVEKSITKPYLMDSGRIHSYTPIYADALVIFPYEYGENGEAILIPPIRMRKEFPRAWEYLSHFKQRLTERNVSPPPAPGEFYRFGRHQALSTAFHPHKIIYSVNQLGDKYGIDSTGVGFASGGTAGEVAISNPRNGYSLEFILALLNQRVSEFYLRKRGSPFRGGYYSRGTAVVADLPVPIIDFKDPHKAAIHDNITLLTRKLIKIQENLLSAIGRKQVQMERKRAAVIVNLNVEFDKIWNFGGQESHLRLPGENSH